MNHACKKSLIVTSAIISTLVIAACLCAALNINTFSLILRFFALAVLLITDLCFFALPYSIILVFALSLYTIIKKDYLKFNFLYMILFTIIILGITNMNIDSLYNNGPYLYNGLDIRSYWHAFCGIVLTAGVLYTFKRKDARAYVYIYTLGLLLYMTYQIVNIVD